MSRLLVEKRFRTTSLFIRERFCNFWTISPAVTPSEMLTAMHTRVNRGAFTRMMWWSDWVGEWRNDTSQIIRRVHTCTIVAAVVAGIGSIWRQQSWQGRIWLLQIRTWRLDARHNFSNNHIWKGSSMCTTEPDLQPSVRTNEETDWLKCLSYLEGTYLAAAQLFCPGKIAMWRTLSTSTSMKVPYKTFPFWKWGKLLASDYYTSL